MQVVQISLHPFRERNSLPSSVGWNLFSIRWQHWSFLLSIMTLVKSSKIWSKQTRWRIAALLLHCEERKWPKFLTWCLASFLRCRISLKTWSAVRITKSKEIHQVLYKDASSHSVLPPNCVKKLICHLCRWRSSNKSLQSSATRNWFNVPGKTIRTRGNAAITCCYKSHNDNRYSDLYGRFYGCRRVKHKGVQSVEGSFI